MLLVLAVSEISKTNVLPGPECYLALGDSVTTVPRNSCVVTREELICCHVHRDRLFLRNCQLYYILLLQKLYILLLECLIRQVCHIGIYTFPLFFYSSGQQGCVWRQKMW